MRIKLFEIRDAATFIPCFAFDVSGTDGYLARRAGYGSRCIMFGRLESGHATHDPYDHKNPRTFPVAHTYIIEHWDELKDGDVIDVEFILGETQTIKTSEEVEEYGKT